MRQHIPFETELGHATCALRLTGDGDIEGVDEGVAEGVADCVGEAEETGVGLAPGNPGNGVGEAVCELFEAKPVYPAPLALVIGAQF